MHVNINKYVHVYCGSRIYWDLVMIFILAVNLILLPIVIAFFSDDYSPQWIVINSITDTLFMIDVFLNFRTGVISSDCKGGEDMVILDTKAIALHYVKSWFVLDVISAIPFDNISLLFIDREENISPLLRASRALRALRLAKLLSLLRLLRLSRLMRYLDTWGEVSCVKHTAVSMIEPCTCVQFLVN